MMTAIFSRFQRLDALFVLLLAGTCLLLFITAPINGEFWWSEASRNALNGALIMDFLYERNR